MCEGLNEVRLAKPFKRTVKETLFSCFLSCFITKLQQTIRQTIMLSNILIKFGDRNCQKKSLLVRHQPAMHIL